MKKLIIAIACVLLLTTAAYAASDTETTTTSFTIGSIFSIAFETDTAAVRYTDGQIAFPLIDPAGPDMVETTATVPADGKSDVGVRCLTNISSDWYLKIRIDESDADLQPTNVAIYKPDQVYLDGTPYSTGIAAEWYIMSPTDELIYGGSGGLQNTTPYGLLATFSFNVLPNGSASPGGQGAIGTGNVLPTGTYNFDVVYTLTTTP